MRGPAVDEPVAGQIHNVGSIHHRVYERLEGQRAIVAQRSDRGEVQARRGSLDLAADVNFREGVSGWGGSQRSRVWAGDGDEGAQLRHGAKTHASPVAAVEPPGEHNPLLQCEDHVLVFGVSELLPMDGVQLGGVGGDPESEPQHALGFVGDRSCFGVTGTDAVRLEQPLSEEHAVVLVREPRKVVDIELHRRALARGGPDLGI